jgi:hypothetical protein
MRLSSLVKPKGQDGLSDAFYMVESREICALTVPLPDKSQSTIPNQHRCWFGRFQDEPTFLNFVVFSQFCGLFGCASYQSSFDVRSRSRRSVLRNGAMRDAELLFHVNDHGAAFGVFVGFSIF